MNNKSQKDNAAEFLTIEEFIDRACKSKEKWGMTWKEIAEHVKKTTGFDRSEKFYRTRFKEMNTYPSENSEEDETCSLDCENCAESCNLDEPVHDNEELIELADYENRLKDLLAEIKKERCKLREETAQNNAYIRVLAREDTIKEIAHDLATQLNEKKFLEEPSTILEDKYSEKEGILLLSDWHYGIVCNNYWNRYDPEIAKERASELVKKVIDYGKNNDIQRLNVLNLGDMISGRIHLSLRLQSRIDVITQIMEVSELLAEVLRSLSEHFIIHYYQCFDNHSRVEPNKPDAIQLESLARITPWFLMERLSNNCNVLFHCNTFDEDIISFRCLGHNIGAAHGDKDYPSKLAENITMMTKKPYDLVCAGHMHHHSEDERNQVEIICNGSLMGTDEYAKDQRLNSKPSQTLIIASENNVREVVYKINL